MSNDVMLKKLVKYVRDENRNPIGVVVALGNDKIGWSSVRFSSELYTIYNEDGVFVGDVRHREQLDRFDKQKGVEIAMGRAMRNSKVRIPRHVMTVYLEIQERAQRYFK